MLDRGDSNLVNDSHLVTTDFDVCAQHTFS